MENHQASELTGTGSLLLFQLLFCFPLFSCQGTDPTKPVFRHPTSVGVFSLACLVCCSIAYPLCFVKRFCGQFLVASEISLLVSARLASQGTRLTKGLAVPLLQHRVENKGWKLYHLGGATLSWHNRSERDRSTHSFGRKRVIVLFRQLADYAIALFALSSTFHTYFNSTTKFVFFLLHVKILGRVSFTFL